MIYFTQVDMTVHFIMESRVTAEMNIFSMYLFVIKSFLVADRLGIEVWRWIA